MRMGDFTFRYLLCSSGDEVIQFSRLDKQTKNAGLLDEGIAKHSNVFSLPDRIRSLNNHFPVIVLMHITVLPGGRRRHPSAIRRTSLAWLPALRAKVAVPQVLRVARVDFRHKYYCVVRAVEMTAVAAEAKSPAN
jgi:hypothetical protein